jgi:hypothetical protein
MAKTNKQGVAGTDGTLPAQQRRDFGKPDDGSVSPINPSASSAVPSMDAPHRGHDPGNAFEESLRRAYPEPDHHIPEPLAVLLRRLRQKAGLPPCRPI